MALSFSLSLSLHLSPSHFSLGIFISRFSFFFFVLVFFFGRCCCRCCCVFLYIFFPGREPFFHFYVYLCACVYAYVCWKCFFFSHSFRWVKIVLMWKAGRTLFWRKRYCSGTHPHHSKLIHGGSKKREKTLSKFFQRNEAVRLLLMMKKKKRE